MPRQCHVCQKTSRGFRKRVKLRGKYNPTTKTRKYPNLQWTRIPLGIKRKKFMEFAGKRTLVCTRCLKTLSKPK